MYIYNCAMRLNDLRGLGCRRRGKVQHHVRDTYAGRAGRHAAMRSWQFCKSVDVLFLFCHLISTLLSEIARALCPLATNLAAARRLRMLERC